MRSMRAPAFVFLAVLLTGHIAEASPQTAQPPAAYEVAAIKPNKSGDTATMVAPNVRGRLVATNASLALLIQSAWGVQPTRIIGASAGTSGWIASERYDIQEKAPTRNGYYSYDETHQMMQALLADRFKLIAHSETRELPVYLLKPAKSGPKLTVTNGHDCFQATLTSKPEDAHGLPACGGFFGRSGHMRGYKVDMARVASQLEVLLKRPVEDRTNLSGKYDIELQWAPLDPAPQAPSQDNFDAAAPSIFTALQEQLGLRLESGKAPIDVLVIDHAERPSEN